MAQFQNDVVARKQREMDERFVVDPTLLFEPRSVCKRPCSDDHSVVESTLAQVKIGCHLVKACETNFSM